MIIPLSIFNLRSLGMVVYSKSFNNMPCTKRAPMNWIIVGSIIRARSIKFRPQIAGTVIFGVTGLSGKDVYV